MVGLLQSIWETRPITSVVRSLAAQLRNYPDEIPMRSPTVMRGRTIFRQLPVFGRRFPCPGMCNP